MLGYSESENYFTENYVLRYIGAIWPPRALTNLSLTAAVAVCCYLASSIKRSIYWECDIKGFDGSDDSDDVRSG
jgi:hypothetical protein